MMAAELDPLLSCHPHITREVSPANKKSNLLSNGIRPLILSMRRLFKTMENMMEMTNKMKRVRKAQRRADIHKVWRFRGFGVVNLAQICFKKSYE